MSNEVTNNGIRFLAISMKNKGIEVNENDLNNFFRNNKDIDVQEAGNSLTQYFRGYLGMGDNFDDNASGALQEALNIIADAEVGDSTISYDEVYGHDYSELIEEQTDPETTETTDAATAGVQTPTGTNDGDKPVEDVTTVPAENNGDKTPGETPTEEEIGYDNLTGSQYIRETLKEYGVELSEEDLNNMLKESNGDVKQLARSIYNNVINNAENLNGNKTDIDLAVSNVLDEIAGEDGIIEQSEINNGNYSIDDGIFDGTEYILQTLTDNGYDIDKKTLKDILKDKNISNENGEIVIDDLYGAINSAIDDGIDTKTKTQLNSVLEEIANGDRTITTDELTADYKSDDKEAPEDVAPESDKPASTSQEPLSIALDSGGKKELYYDEDGNPKIKLYNSLGGLVYERNIYKYERAQFNELGANIPEPEPEKTDEAGGTEGEDSGKDDGDEPKAYVGYATLENLTRGTRGNFSYVSDDGNGNKTYWTQIDKLSRLDGILTTTNPFFNNTNNQSNGFINKDANTICVANPNWKNGDDINEKYIIIGGTKENDKGKTEYYINDEAFSNYIDALESKTNELFSSLEISDQKQEDIAELFNNIRNNKDNPASSEFYNSLEKLMKSLYRYQTTANSIQQTNTPATEATGGQSGETFPAITDERGVDPTSDHKIPRDENGNIQQREIPADTNLTPVENLDDVYIYEVDGKQYYYTKTDTIIALTDWLDENTDFFERDNNIYIRNPYWNNGDNEDEKFVVIAAEDKKGNYYVDNELYSSIVAKYLENAKEVYETVNSNDNYKYSPMGENFIAAYEALLNAESYYGGNMGNYLATIMGYSELLPNM